MYLASTIAKVLYILHYTVTRAKTLREFNDFPIPEAAHTHHIHFAVSVTTMSVLLATHQFWVVWVYGTVFPQVIY